MLRWATLDADIHVQGHPSWFMTAAERAELALDSALASWQVVDIPHEVRALVGRAEEMFREARKDALPEAAAVLATRAHALRGDAAVLFETAADLEKVVSVYFTDELVLRHVLVTSTSVIKVTGHLPGLGRSDDYLNTYASGNVAPGCVPDVVVTSEVFPFAGRTLLWRDGVLSSGRDFAVPVPAGAVAAVVAATAVTTAG